MEKVEVSMDHFSLKALLHVRLQNTHNNLKVILKPSWLGILKGVLHFNSIEVEADYLDLSSIKFPKGVREEAKNLKFESWNSKNIFRKILEIYSDLFPRREAKFFFKFDKILYIDRDTEDVGFQFSNIAFSIVCVQKDKKDLQCYFNFLEPFSVKSKSFYPGRILQFESLEGDIVIGDKGAYLSLLNCNLNNNHLIAKFAVKNTLQDLLFDMNISFSKVINLDYLKYVWPEKLGEGGRLWVVENLKKGVISNLKATGSFKIGKKGEFQDPKIKGSFFLKNGSLSYLKGQPLITNLDAKASFSENDLSFLIEKGFLEEARIDKSRVHLYDFQEPIQKIKIIAEIKGGFSGILKTLNKDPLRYPDKIKLVPDSVHGKTKGLLKFSFPLLKKLTFSQVELAAEGCISEFSMSNLPTEYFNDFNEGTLRYNITNDKLEVRGKGVLDTIKVDIGWKSNFKKSDDWENKIFLKGQAPLTLAKRFFDLPLAIKSQKGIIFDILYTTYISKDSTLQLTLDAEPLSIVLPWIFFEKKPGEKAFFKGLFSFDKERGVHLKKFLFSGKGGATKNQFEVKGSLVIDKEHSIKSVSIHNTKFSGNNIKKAVLSRLEGGGWSIDLQSESLNLLPYWKKYFQEDTLEKENFLEKDYIIKVNSEEVTLADSLFPMEGVEFSANLTDGSFEYVRLKANTSSNTSTTKNNMVNIDYRKRRVDLDKGSSVNLSIDKSSQNFLESSLLVESDNLGSFLNQLGFVDKVVGGFLKVNMKSSDKSLWTGSLDIKNIIVLDVPSILKFVSLISITGVHNVLNEKGGLFFSSIKSNFTYEKDVFSISKFLAESSSMGITAQGKVVLFPKQELNLKGTVVPVNFINGFFSYIPIIGHIITGGEGEGIFSVSFGVKGSFSKPKIEINPISVLTPGILRKIFM